MTITLYTMPNCPHCVRAKTALDAHGVTYSAVSIPDKSKRHAFYDGIADDMSVYPENVRRTMPKLQAGDTWVPSADDIVAMCLNGML